MIKLSLVRHGQTVENITGYLQGQSDGHLNDTGVRQAEELRDILHPQDYDLLVCSDLLRTRLTADILNQRLHLPITYTPLLRERDWGEFTGRHIREITMPPSEFPDSVENAEQLANRAKRFVMFLLQNFNDTRILAVGHGYFNRCVQAVIEEKTVHDTPRWDNTEVRTFTFDNSIEQHTAPTDYIISEN